MRFDDRQHLANLEARVAAICGTRKISQALSAGTTDSTVPSGGDGTDAAQSGHEIETEVAAAIQAAAGGVASVPRSRVADETGRRTRQQVDLLLLDKDAARPVALVGVAQDLEIRAVRGALEIKRTDGAQHWESVLAQLASIKSLTRMRRQDQPPQVLEGMPRGNIFCGAVFACPQLDGQKLASTWKTRIESLQNRFPALWRSCDPLDSVCDSGRYPNFFWGWGKYVVLKCYALGDVDNARPPHFDWTELARFNAPSRATSIDEDSVIYYLGRPSGAAGPTVLELFRVRLRKEARAFLSDSADEDKRFE